MKTMHAKMTGLSLAVWLLTASTRACYAGFAPGLNNRIAAEEVSKNVSTLKGCNQFMLFACGLLHTNHHTYNTPFKTKIYSPLISLAGKKAM